MPWWFDPVLAGNLFVGAVSGVLIGEAIIRGIDYLIERGGRNRI
ncbi:hypothetical protein [Salinithrix halophila]|uniref:Uncharacterized protein n=1 Tax=Salinithrix halophila TaxID=1485204 RepID=A0ABV8JD44_9BACL